MSSHEDEEETGPSVDSNDPEERIAARRQRITKRIEAAKREAMGEDPNAKKKEDKEEQSKSRKQIEDSRQRLTKLKTDGSELVSNVRVAGDSREAHRRTEEEENYRQRTEKLEAEAKAGAERFEEITKKWESAHNKDVPQDLHDLLMQQKALCGAMLDEKNKLITDFQMELKAKDDQYVKDLKKQAEDIDLMIERMEEQVKNLTRSYREELNQIEKAFDAERNELLDTDKKKWEQTMQSRRDKEVDCMKSREKRVEDYEQQIQHLRTQDAEEYNMVKIKLETDVQILEQQLQQMRATYQLNQEKLEYNFQVLKKRDEENTITKSQQKRKITRLQDVLNNLKVKLAKQEKQYREDNQALADDYKRITEQFKELQKKAKHFQATDTRKFHDIWIMNENEAKQLVNEVVEQDRIIHEQQLGLQWLSPDVSFMENVGPLTSAKKKTVSAVQVLEELMSSTKGSVDGQEEEEAEEEEEEEGEEEAAEAEEGTPRLSMKTIKQVLELLCDESGFLVESKLNKLLQPLEKDERSLMKLDAIFGALGVETEDDIQKLAGYFLQAKPVTQKTVDKHGEEVEPQTSVQDGELALQTEGSVSGIGDGTLRTTVTGTATEDGETKESQEHEGEEEEQDVDDEVAKVTGEDEEVASVHTSVKSVGDTLIHPNDVLKSLMDFVDDHHTQSKDKSKYQTFQIISGVERDDSGDEEYWSKYKSILTTQKGKVWTALVTGLDKYSDVLHQRTKLISETDGLRQQNAELRMLLHQYINSKVNNELEVPPTRVLNLEFGQ